MSLRSILTIVSLCVVAAVAITAWLAVGMSSGTASAQELVEVAQAKNRAVQSYRFSMELWQTPQTEGDPPRYESSTQGVVVVNEGIHRSGSGNLNRGISGIAA